MEKSTLFECEEAEELNALYQALHEAAECEDYSESAKLYDYMHGAPRTLLVHDIVQKLNENGYHIVRDK